MNLKNFESIKIREIRVASVNTPPTADGADGRARGFYLVGGNRTPPYPTSH
jgi:hypothetical protein